MLSLNYFHSIHFVPLDVTGVQINIQPTLGGLPKINVKIIYDSPKKLIDLYNQFLSCSVFLSLSNKRSAPPDPNHPPYHLLQVLDTDPARHELMKEQMKKKIISLSVDFSIVTQFTSFVAVEEREVS